MLMTAVSRKADVQIVKSHTQDVPIGALYDQRWRYEDSPPFQREKVWPEKMKRNLIDSLLRGFYIPPLLLSPKYDALKGQLYWVVDGQQRLKSIYEYMDNGFRTGRLSKTDEPNYAPLEPNKFFSELPFDAQEQIRSYSIRLIILDEAQDNLLSVMYRRVQEQIPLTTAEKLFSYESEATRQATELANHPFFSEVYGGRVTRKEPFQGALYAIMVELAGGFASYQQQQTRRVAAGLKDTEITEAVLAKVNKRLEYARHLFAGVRTRALLEIIVCYQTVMMLELLGYDLLSSQEGCLAEWMRQQQAVQASEQQERGYMSLFYLIGDMNKQKSFWVNQLSPLALIPGLVCENKSTAMTQTQRILSWIKQSGNCINCHKSIRLLDINNHAFRSEDRLSPTTCIAAVNK